ncbi:unnamed protein product [Rotaria sp. Silwood2]|nr:unnamed protein product [Rotaria sp. Silwood2]CAF2682358.1 unnamed protein product [Rotaria sp. Silwood2]CAF4410427.1 unnamed protein product [Rotaria sp. Silwood2]CAF4417546.1 unnamed protein product [Rotaria sp. Silwood2]
MPFIELIPLNKGNHIILDDTIITTIGRTPNIGCLDNKISRNHAQLFIKSDGTLWIKPIHHNPTFYKTKTNQIVTLTKNKEYQLHHNDQFGLLPDEYFYRVSIQSKDKQLEKLSDSNQIINSSTIPKSSIKDNEVLTIENHDEKKFEVTTSSISDKTRALPTWMSNSSISTSSSHDKEQNKETSITTSSTIKQTYSEGKKTKEIVYDDDDAELTSVTSSTEQASTSNDVDLTTNCQTSSIVNNPIKRERCPYGESCYRKNLAHRQQAIHPGDSDWNAEENNKNKTKPECPYGNECYRKNSDHLNEYHHPKKRCIEIKSKQRTTKRKANEDEDDDDDGLPNEYDYNDSFIDDEELDDSNRITDQEEIIESDDDTEWKPPKNSRCFDESDDDSSDDSEIDLTKQEAVEFVKGSTAENHGPVIKKPRFEDESDD